MILEEWVKQYQLFLFDFDGLLVNTEELHYEAYKRMCARRGFNLKWDFHRYSQASLFEATALRDQIYEEFPSLREMEPNWEVLYKEKKKAYLEILYEGKVGLLPGVAKLLTFLSQNHTKMCVVTHSPSEQVQLIRKFQPLLDLIPVWITREDYTHPKPHPDPYLTAIERMALPHEQIIGFEDSPRGLQALSGTRAQPVLVALHDHVNIKEKPFDRVLHFQTFDHII